MAPPAASWRDVVATEVEKIAKCMEPAVGPRRRNVTAACFTDLRSGITRDYIRRSMYWPELEPWYEQFPASSVLVIDADELRKDAVGTLRRVHDFVGLERVDVLPQSSEELEEKCAARARLSVWVCYCNARPCARAELMPSTQHFGARRSGRAQVATSPWARRSERRSPSFSGRTTRGCLQ